jgi:hypothetical protein
MPSNHDYLLLSRRRPRSEKRNLANNQRNMASYCVLQEPQAA